MTVYFVNDEFEEEKVDLSLNRSVEELIDSYCDYVDNMQHLEEEEYSKAVADLDFSALEGRLLELPQKPQYLIDTMRRKFYELT